MDCRSGKVGRGERDTTRFDLTWGYFLSASMTTPAPVMQTASHSRSDGRSPRNKIANAITSTMLNLSMGATSET